MTAYAKKILNLINGSSSHMTAEQIFLELKKTEPKIVLASVYNNLSTLSAGGLIRKIGMDGAADRYDKTVKHDHLVCKKCGEIADFGFTDLTEGLQKELNCGILGYDLKIYYLCAECKAAQNY